MKNLKKIFGVAISAFLLLSTASDATEEEKKELSIKVQKTLKFLEGQGVSNTGMSATEIDLLIKDLNDQSEEMKQLTQKVEIERRELEQRVGKKIQSWDSAAAAEKEVQEIVAQNQNFLKKKKKRKEDVEYKRQQNALAQKMLKEKDEDIYNMLTSMIETKKQMQQIGDTKKDFKTQVDGQTEYLNQEIKRTNSETQNLLSEIKKLQGILGNPQLQGEEIENLLQQPREQQVTQIVNPVESTTNEVKTQEQKTPAKAEFSVDQVQELSQSVFDARANLQELLRLKGLVQGKTFNGKSVDDVILAKGGKTLNQRIEEHQKVQRNKK